MPLSIDGIDVSILNSILEDGRKSFRQISRDTGITTPTVKARYERLVNGSNQHQNVTITADFVLEVVWDGYLTTI